MAATTEPEFSIEQLQFQIAIMRTALTKIQAIEDQMYGPDWEEIDEARTIATEALNAAGDSPSNQIFEPVAEWVNEEHGFQYLKLGRLPEGTQLFALTFTKRADSEPEVLKNLTATAESMMKLLRGQKHHAVLLQHGELVYSEIFGRWQDSIDASWDMLGGHPDSNGEEP